MHGSSAGKEIAIPPAQFVIGRDEGCHLRPRSDAVSRRHCALLMDDKQVIIQDFGSKNGTLVNGQRIEGTQVLNHGDELQVGPLRFEVVIEHSLGGGKRPVVRDVKEAAARTAESRTDDLDISSWLEDGDVNEEATRAVPDTRQFRLDQTDQVALDTVDSSTDHDTSDSSVGGDSDKEKGRWKKAEKGKLPPRPTIQATDSREAAAEMLRRFFNRR
jgi:pSer/pThr/pTyr-binding forkhead associated (FHA) protein